MPKSNVVVTYRNLHPSEDTKSFVDSIVNEIQHELPMNSTIKATFSAKDDVVKGILQVNSHGGPFFAVAASTSINEISMKLLEQMRRRLDKFKTKTYRRKSVKDLQIKQDSFEAYDELDSYRAS